MRRTALALAALAALLAAPPPADAAMRFRDCDDFAVRCARLSVPLDRTGRVPGRVSLLVQRVRATRRRARGKGAIFVLAGGPGQSATDAFEGDALGALSPAYRDRDLVIFDQRGTGRSGVLRCKRLEKANLLNAGGEAAACAGKLGPRRSLYTTRDSADDMEAIRRELGIERIAIFGTSYGTKVALAYALRYPGSVERLVLDSVVEPGGPDPLYRDTFAVVPRALRALCRTGCARITTDPIADVRALTDRLASGPMQGVVVDARGRRRTRSFDRGDLFIVLLAGDFDPSLRAAFPAAVRSALNGDPALLLRLKRRALQIDAQPPPPRSLSATLYATTTCEESAFPWSRTSPGGLPRRIQARAAVTAEPDATFRPFDRETALDTDLLALCRHWPFGPIAPSLGSGPLPDVPVLLMEGEDDLRTPVENAQRVAAYFPRSTLLVAPATGHSALGADSSGCMERAFSRFFLNRRLPRGCKRKRREFAPLPVAPISLAAVTPAGRLRGLRGRLVTSVALTLRDVSDDTLTSVIADDDPDLARGGGLRGGRYRVAGNNTLLLKSVEFVPGVRVTGRVRGFGEDSQRGRLRVRVRGGLSARLAVRGDRVRGRVGRSRIRDRLRPRPTLADEARASAASLPGPPGALR